MYMDPEVYVPAIFVVVSLLMGIVAIRVARHKNAVEREAAQRLASLLGLEYLDPEAEFMRASENVDPKYARFAQNGLVKAIQGFFKFMAPWRLVGKRGEVRIEVYPETRSTGKNSTTYTVARAYLSRPLAYSLKISREGFFTKLGKLVANLQDLEEVDKAVRIKASDPVSAKVLLDRHEIRQAILDAIGKYKSLRIEESFAHWEKMGVTTDTAEIGEVLDALVTVAEALGGE
jgi:hypothetical protein